MAYILVIILFFHHGGYATGKAQVFDLRAECESARVVSEAALAMRNPHVKMVQGHCLEMRRETAQPQPKLNINPKPEALNVPSMRRPA